MNSLFNRKVKDFGISDTAKLIFGIAGCAFLTLFPLPPQLSQLFFEPGWKFLFFLLVFYTLLFNKNGPMWEVLQMGFTIGLFILPLLYKWQVALVDGFLIGGLLPWSDASGYIFEAQRLASGLLLSPWGAQQRPFFAGFLAVTLRLSGENLMATLVAFAFLNAIATFLATRLVKRIFNPLGSGVYLLLAYEFYMRFAGEFMTEQLGFLLGNLAFCFLLVGFYNKQFSSTIWGLGILTLALNARAGAFFILPMVLFWVLLRFRLQVTWWKATGYPVLIVVLVFLINFLFAFILSGKTGTTFASYPYTLYGLASGNKGWHQVLKDYPNITRPEVMPLAIQKIRETPGLFVYGMKESFLDYFNEYTGAFSFNFFKPGDQKALTLFLWGFAVIGLAHSIWDIRNGTGISFISFLGITLSLSLLPPIDSDRMRVFAATIPFTALWVLEGVTVTYGYLNNLIVSTKVNNAEDDDNTVSIKPVLGFSVLIIVLVTIAPPLLRFVPVDLKNTSPAPLCKPGEDPFQFFVFENASFFLVRDNYVGESYMPLIRISDFRDFQKYGLYPFLEDKLLSLKVGDGITYGMLIARDEIAKQVFLVSNFPSEKGMISACGQYATDESLRSYGFVELRDENSRIPKLTLSQRNPMLTFMIRIVYALGLGVIIYVLTVNQIVMITKWVLRKLSIRSMVMALLASQGLLMNMYVKGALPVPFLKQQLVLTVRDENFVEGNLFTIPLETTWMNQAELGLSPAIAYEDNVPLDYPNSLHQDIIDQGNGRYSVWNGLLYLSSSDNTDPRTNGRVYEIEWPYPVAPAIQWVSYLLSIGGIGYVFISPLFKKRIDLK